MDSTLNKLVSLNGAISAAMLKYFDCSLPVLIGTIVQGWNYRISFRSLNMSF